MSAPQHILVIRFSALGDVAMTVPVLQQALQQNPQLQITVVSQAFCEPLFAGLERCQFYPAHLKTVHKGAAGIYALYRELVKKYRFDAVADLHGVLRSHLLRFFFRLGGYPTAVIDKGRAAKKALTRRTDKDFRQLTSSFERYAAVLADLGLTIKLHAQQPVYRQSKQLPVEIKTEKPWIGIAPFAQHREKMYPVEKMKLVVEKLAHQYTVLLFGGGKEEAAVLQEWADHIPGVLNMAGQYSLKEELALISRLSMMISMDSANMHLASLYGVPVVSIWGATHPFAGFYGWGQSTENIISKNLSCRPCSVFGNKPCWRGDHACMQQITPEEIVERVVKMLKVES